MRVYLTNVETICRKFVDDKRESLAVLRGVGGDFKSFWNSLDAKRKRTLATEKESVILKVQALEAAMSWRELCSC